MNIPASPVSGIPGTTETVPPEVSLLSGVNVLLEGPTGTGKTYSIGTLVDAGVEVFYEGLESGLETLIGYWTDNGKPIPLNLHWHTMTTVQGGFETLAKAAQDIGNMTQDSLHKVHDMERGGPNNLFYQYMQQMINWKDARTGQAFGSVGKWGPDKALVIDGMTGLGAIAMALVVGKKPVRSQADWGIAQDQLEKLIRQLCDGCACHFVLLAHVERETDLVNGGVKLTVSTLGRALPPKIPPMFSDVILTVRTGTAWTWSTANALADLKTRNLPYAEGLKPDFSQIINKWKSRGGRLSPTVKV